MNKSTILLLVFLMIMTLFTGCGPDQENSDSPEEKVTEEVTNDLTNKQEQEEKDRKTDNQKKFNMQETTDKGDSSNPELDEKSADKEVHYSPFSGEIIKEEKFKKALMVIIENSPSARPQSGLEEASVVYEVLVEGGITRFLALYWDKIPEKIGPVRSARPYIIRIAEEYNALLLHAGASPGGFALFSENIVEHLDQITKSRYYWRSSDKKAPHNLYTGKKFIIDYLDKLIGQEYEQRFSFQNISVVRPNDKRADRIVVPFWGGNSVIYTYDKQKNQYYRYHKTVENPHMEKDKQLSADNIIIQYVKTRVIDDVGRLSMELDSRGKAILIKDGIVVEGFWEKNENTWTEFYNNLGQEIKLNPGQTWIELVPDTLEVKLTNSDKS